MPEPGAGFVWVTATRTIITRKCNLLGAWLVASDGGVATATLYNGVDTNGPIIIVLSAATSEMGSLAPKKALLCENGLHLVKGSNVTGVLVEWEPL